MSVLRNTIRLVALLLLPLAVGMTIGSKRVAARLARQSYQTEALPDRWVPFTADVTVTAPDEQRTVGRFFRRSDGSRRLETGPTEGDAQVIFILNTIEFSTFTYRTGVGWSVQAVDRSNGPFLPPQRLPTRPDLAPYPYRLALKRGESGSLNSEAGFSAYQLNAPDGTMKLSVPELNFFDVVFRLGNGRLETYTNIELRESPPELFRPPANAMVTRRVPKGFEL